MAAEHAYRYGRASALEPRASGVGCVLVGDSDGLFKGRVQHPRTAALGLRAVSEVVMSRFYAPPGVWQALLDPVVTVGRKELRFEGFSGCCSTYARLDLSAEAFGEVTERTPGTTNVDFQGPMRAALAKVRDSSELVLEVGRESVSVDTGESQVVERKVPFPMRWLKGLGEVQAYLSRMQLVHTLSRSEALRFLRSLPRTSRHESFVQKAGRGLRLTQVASADSVRVTGVERLRVLEGLVPLCKELRVYREPFGASTWALDFGGEVFSLTLSPERWRGFSGEGQLLSTLATGEGVGVLERVRASLSWQDEIRPSELAASVGVPEATILEALAMLASRGLTGFDLETRAWFYRELPFELELVEALHPRLKSARKLVESNAVEISITSEEVKARVHSGDATYRVRLAKEVAECTCPWYAKHKGERGPCKHVLASQIAVESCE